MYKAIIFDFDETLVKAYEVKWKQHQETAKQFYNLNLTEKTIKKYWGMPFEKMIYLMYSKKDKVENMIENYHSLDEKFVKKPFPDTKKVIKKLFKLNYWLGVLTSMNSESVKKDLEKINIDPNQFKVILGSNDLKFHKPDPRVFDYLKKILKKEKINSKEIVYIGDDQKDMEASLGAGIDFIAIPNGLTKPEDFRNNNVICIKKLSELMEII